MNSQQVQAFLNDRILDVCAIDIDVMLIIGSPELLFKTKIVIQTLLYY